MVYKTLENKIRTKKAVICIVGLGYVGLPLALMFCKKYKVIGFDLSRKKIESLRKGESYIADAPTPKLKKYLNKKFFPTDNEEELRKADIIMIAVPTPLDESKKPDLSYVKGASEIISRNMRKGQLIILESTTYPGTTEELMVPILQKSKLKLYKDFLVAFSPERVDPGNKKWTTENTPKVVGGIDEKTGEIAQKLYQSVIKAQIYKVSTCKAAEAAKILENTFREINIALINELALMFEKLDINIWEVIEAAKTKPHSFMAHYPGPGVGGHCIPLDPYYLTYQAQKIESFSRFIELAGVVNDHMKMHAINLVRVGLAKKRKKLNYKTTITVMGVAYKKDIDDLRESPSLKIIEELLNLDVKLKVHDPFVKEFKINNEIIKTEPNIKEAAKNSDCLLFITDHTKFKKIKFNEIKKVMKTPIIVDTRNMFEPKQLKGFIYQGLGKPL